MGVLGCCCAFALVDFAMFNIKIFISNTNIKSIMYVLLHMYILVSKVFEWRPFNVKCVLCVFPFKETILACFYVFVGIFRLILVCMMRVRARKCLNCRIFYLFVVQVVVLQCLSFKNEEHKPNLKRGLGNV